jgi:hypothetical protein
MRVLIYCLSSEGEWLRAYFRFDPNPLCALQPKGGRDNPKYPAMCSDLGIRIGIDCSDYAMTR